MNKFAKLVNQADLKQTNDNTKRNGNTAIQTNEEKEFIRLDARRLRRVDRPHQFNTKIKSELHEQLYRIVLEKRITITEVIETALTDYFAKLRSEK